MKSLRKQRSSVRRSRQLQLEPLESRRLLAPVNVQVNEPNDGTQFEPSLYVAGDKVRVFYTSSDSGSNLRSVRFATSLDQGQSFEPQTTNTTGWDRPAAVYDPLRGREYLVSTERYGNFIRVRASGDAFFKDSLIQFAGVSRLSEPSIAADSFAGGGNVYILLQGNSDGLVADGMYLIRSTDGVQTWSEPLRISSDPAASRGWLAIGPDHSVHALWQVAAGGFTSIVTRRSTDGGVTFGPLVAVGGQQASNVQAVANPVSGHLYAVYTDDLPGPSGKDVMFTMSTDQGATWSVPAVVNDDGTETNQYGPTIAVTPNGGRLFVGFRDQRVHPGQDLTDSFGAIATSGGSSVAFGRNFRISSASDPVRTGPARFTQKMNQAVADENRFYYSWFDGRNPSSDGTQLTQNDVFAARIGLRGPLGPYVYSSTPEGLQVNASVTSATVTFSQAMDTTSFDVAADVVSFSGAGRDLKSTITGFTWLSDRTLQINFAPIDATGTYTLVLGPNILNKWGNPQDNNFNSIAGEEDDTGVVTIAIQRLPLYTAYAAPALTGFKLALGAPGVVERTPQDTRPIDLESRTFTYYGRQYTGGQIWAAHSGSLRVGNSAGANPLIQVLAGAVRNSTVLYSFRDVTNDGVEDLIVAWQTYDDSISFQAVLELGTGDKQGAMLFNYPDIDDPRDPANSHARSATISVDNGGIPMEATYIAYEDGFGDIGVRSGMGLVIRDDRRGQQVLRFDDSVHVFGSANDDRIEATYDSGTYKIKRNNAETAISAATLSALYIHGSGGNDRIHVFGAQHDDTIGLDGNSGNDSLLLGFNGMARLYGGAGNDYLYGGAHSDELEGGPGNDQLYGYGGDDTYFFGARTNVSEVDLAHEGPDGGVDTIDYSMLPQLQSATVDLRSDAKMAANGNRIVRELAGYAQYFENVNGGGGDDHLIGNDAANSLRGNAGNDRLEGAPGNDLLVGGSGSDRLIGGRGNDIYRLLPGIAQLAREDDTLVEATDQGRDTLDFSSLPEGMDLTLNLAESSDGIIGSHFRRRLLGHGVNFERVLGGAGNDVITGNSLDNELIGNGGSDELDGGGGNDLLSGSDGIDSLTGGAGNDTLYGGDGFDDLNGGAGNDRLYGGVGDDRYVFGLPVGNEIDHVFEVFNAGVDELDFSPLPASIPVTINLAQNNLATHAGRKVWTGIKNTYLNLENATGGAGDDTLIGNTKNNRLVGGPGDDTFEGGGGTDQLVQ